MIVIPALATPLTRGRSNLLLSSVPFDYEIHYYMESNGEWIVTQSSNYSCLI